MTSIMFLTTPTSVPCFIFLPLWTRTGWEAMRRYLSKETPEMRAQWRKEILATTKEDFAAFGARLEEVHNKKEVKGISKRERITCPQYHLVFVCFLKCLVFANKNTFVTLLF